MQAADCILSAVGGDRFLVQGDSPRPEIWAWKARSAYLVFLPEHLRQRKKTQFHRSFPENIGASHQIWEVPKRDSAPNINCMSNSRAPVKQSEITRAVRGVLAAGIQVGKVVVGPDGRVEIFPVGAVPAGEDGSINPCDVLLAGRCA